MALGGRARATCSGSTPRRPSPPGSASRWWPAPPRRSPRFSTPPPGGACPRAKARRGRASPTGPTSNWPTWTRRVPGRRDRPLDARPAGPARPRRRRVAYFTTSCPAGTTIEALVAAEGRRWAIEDAFETAKTELGLDHDETRSWHGWHRHVSLVMLAFAMLAAIRLRANTPPPPKTLITLTRTRRASSAGRSRKSAASPCASRSDASGQPASSPGRSGDAHTKPRRDAHI